MLEFNLRSRKEGGSIVIAKLDRSSETDLSLVLNDPSSNELPAKYRTKAQHTVINRKIKKFLIACSPLIAIVEQYRSYFCQIAKEKTLEELYVDDPIVQSLGYILDGIKGFPGDIMVFVLLALVLVSLYRCKIQPAIGYLILTIGVVIIRVLIYNLF